MANATPRRIAASILSMDLDMVDGYWQERWPNIPEDMREQVDAEMQKILKPFYERLNKIAKDVRATRVGTEK